MNITWLGENCVKIESKSATVVVDPFSSKVAKMPKVNADIVLLSRPYEDKDLSFAKSDVFVVDTPGEYESRDVFMQAKLADERGELAFRFTVEDMSVGYTGNITSVSSEVTDFLEGVDVLLIPAGGDDCLGTDAAVKAANIIEPRIIVPVRVREKNASKRNSGADFAKEFGVSAADIEEKLVLKKKELPMEETRVVLLQV